MAHSDLRGPLKLFLLKNGQKNRSFRGSETPVNHG
jgi:hypothetical protein